MNAARDRTARRSQAASRTERPIRSFLLALAMHALLFVALWIGVQWRTQPQPEVSAELWSLPTAELTRTAPVEIAPEPTVPPAPVTPAPVPPPPVVSPQPRVVQPERPDADIVEQQAKAAAKLAEQRRIEEAKVKAEKERQKAEEERQRLAAEKRKIEEAKVKAEAERRKAVEEKQRLAAEQRKVEEAKRKAEEEKQKLAAEKRRLEEEKLRAAAAKRKADEERRAAEAAAQAKAAAERAAAQQREAMRRDEQQRMMSQAGATGGTAAAGSSNAARDAAYANQIAALIKQHVDFSVPPGTSSSIYAEFHVELLPTGEIMSVKLIKPSGLAGYDAAAERGIRRTQAFPPKRDGTFERSMNVRQYPGR